MEHKSGRAIDIIVVPKIGMRPDGDEYNAAIRLVNLLIKHGKTLRIQWILFTRRSSNPFLQHGPYGMEEARKPWQRLR